MGSDRDPFMITDPEAQVVRLLGAAWDAFLNLPVEHGDHQTDFRQAIHRAQDIILGRVGARQINLPKRPT